MLSGDAVTAAGPVLCHAARLGCGGRLRVCRMRLDRVFGNEKLCGDLAIAEAAGDQGENFELACRDAEGLLLGRIGSERLGAGSFCGDKHFPDHDCFADGFAAARDAEAEPDSESREEDGDERAVEFDRVFDDDEAVFGVLEGGDEEAADETEDDDVALHDGVVRKYNGDGEVVASRGSEIRAWTSANWPDWSLIT